MIKGPVKVAEPVSEPPATTSTSGPVASGGRWSRERVLKKFPLLYPTLEGLARYTHLIDVGYFNDLMDVFKQVMQTELMQFAIVI